MGGTPRAQWNTVELYRCVKSVILPKLAADFRLGLANSRRIVKIERMRYADKIPYVFILDYLVGVDIEIKPMFGCYGIYANGKLCLFLMHREKPLIRRDGDPMQKGVYVATTEDNVSSLRRNFARAEFEMLKEGKVWFFFSETLPEFEDYTVKACELIRSGDVRIGR